MLSSVFLKTMLKGDLLRSVAFGFIIAQARAKILYRRQPKNLLFCLRPRRVCKSNDTINKQMFSNQPKNAVGDCVFAHNHSFGAKRFPGIALKILVVFCILYLLNVICGNIIKINYVIDGMMLN